MKATSVDIEVNVSLTIERDPFVAAAEATGTETEHYPINNHPHVRSMQLTTKLGTCRGPKHPTLSEDCYQRIVVARTALITNFAFFGIIAAKLQPVEDNVNCKTLATDGKHLFYNVQFVMGVEEDKRAEYEQELRDAFPDITDEQVREATLGLDNAELRAGIVHEIMHCMMEHFIRRNYRNPQKWNKAADFAINQIIRKEGIGKIRKSWLDDPKYDNMTAEEIYPLLPDDDGEDGNGEGQGASMDHHWDGEPGDGGEGGEGDGQDKGSVGDLFSHADADDIKENFEDFKQTVEAAAQAAAVPEGLKRFIDSLSEPKVDWRTRIKRSLQSWMKRDMTFQRPNRRSWHMGCVMPGFLPQEDIDVCVALDMSGSITEAMARDMLSEVYGMMKQFDCFRIHLICFDTRVYAPADFDESNVEKLFEYQIKGGGGTDFDAVWQYMKAEDYKPKQLLFFTDGYPCGSWGDPDYVDTLFIIHGTTSIVAPFGETLYYEFSEGVV